MLQTHSEVSRSGYNPAFGATPLDALNALGTRIVVRRGREVYAEGDPAKFCYKLISGSVRAVKQMADGHRQICEFLLPGGYLGFESQGEYYFGAEAVTDAVLISYPRQRVERLIAENPAFAGEIRRLATRGLQSAYQRMVLLTHKSAEERMAWFLLELAERSENEDCIDLPMSRTDIADYLGMVIETVSRALSQLKRAGTIAMKSVNRIQLIDRDMLEHVRGEI